MPVVNRTFFYIIRVPCRALQFGSSQPWHREEICPLIRLFYSSFESLLDSLFDSPFLLSLKYRLKRPMSAL